MNPQVSRLIMPRMVLAGIFGFCRVTYRICELRFGIIFWCDVIIIGLSGMFDTIRSVL